jgi:hypothetical protein
VILGEENEVGIFRLPFFLFAHTNHYCHSHAMATSSQHVALVIGASRGIGRQIAVDLAKSGYAGKFLCVRRPQHVRFPG